MNRELDSPQIAPEARFCPDIAEGGVELVKFGSSSFASCAYGERVSDDKIYGTIELMSGTNPKSRQDVERLMQASGIKMRYSSKEIAKDPAQVLEMAAEIGGRLTRVVMAGQGWDSIDYFVDCSSTLPVDIGRRVLGSAGLEIEGVTVKPYRAACAGAVMAFVDTLADEKLQDKRVVICAMETLSQLIACEHFSSDLENVSVPLIFGDDYAAIAYRPSDFQLVSAQNRIVYDGAPTRFNTDYEIPRGARCDANGYYVFGNGGRENINVSDDGVFLNIHKPTGGLPFEMDGRATAKFFIRETVDVIKQVYEDALRRGVSVKKVIMHQPSLRVTDGISRRIRADATLKDLELPDFILGDIERSNSGSATTLVVWQNLVKRKFIDPGEPFLICAPGIGAAISAAVVVPNREF